MKLRQSIIAALDDAMTDKQTAPPDNSPGQNQPRNHAPQHHHHHRHHHIDQIATTLRPISGQLAQLYQKAGTPYHLADVEKALKDVGSQNDTPPIVVAKLLAARLKNPDHLQEIQNAVSAAADKMTSNEILQRTLEINPASNAFTFAQPVDSYKITSPFGFRNKPRSHATREHEGVDLAAPAGTPVHAVMAGIVENIQDTAETKGDRGIGDIITIFHGIDPLGQKIQTRYIHVTDPLVQIGDTVTGGQQIAVIGTGYQKSGDWTGPHVHLEIRQRDDHDNKSIGHAINPASYIRHEHPKKMELAELAVPPGENKIASVIALSHPNPIHLGPHQEFLAVADTQRAKAIAAPDVQPTSAPQLTFVPSNLKPLTP